MISRLAGTILLASFAAAGLVSILILGSFSELAEPKALSALWYLTLAGFLMRSDPLLVLKALGLVGGVAFLLLAMTQFIGSGFAGYLALAGLMSLQLAAYEVLTEPTRDETAMLPALFLLSICLARPESTWLEVVGGGALAHYLLFLVGSSSALLPAMLHFWQPAPGRSLRSHFSCYLGVSRIRVRCCWMRTLETQWRRERAMEKRVAIRKMFNWLLCDSWEGCAHAVGTTCILRGR